MRTWLLASVVLLGSAANSVAATITYDAVSDFSTSSNPNGVWSYGYGSATAAGLTFTAFTTVSSNFGSPAWNMQGQLPLVGQAYTGSTVAVPTNDLWLHPGNFSSPSAILRFTAPTSGIYNYSGLFERADTVDGGGDGVLAFIFENNTSLKSSYIPASTGSHSSFSNSLSLAQGDTVSFVVDPFVDNGFDSTGVRVSLTTNQADPTAVPEPATLALFATGMLGLVAARRRRSPE